MLGQARCSRPPRSRCPTCAAAARGRGRRAARRCSRPPRSAPRRRRSCRSPQPRWVTAAFLVATAPRRPSAGPTDGLDERPVGPDQEEGLAVAQARDGADLLARGVVDPDLGTDVALRIDVDPPDVAELAEQRAELVDVVEPLVRDRDEQPAAPGAPRAAPRTPPAPRASSCRRSAARGSRRACSRRRRSRAHPSGRASPRRGSWRRTSAGCTAGRRRRGRRRAAVRARSRRAARPFPAGPGDARAAAARARCRSAAPRT